MTLIAEPFRVSFQETVLQPLCKVVRSDCQLCHLCKPCLVWPGEDGMIEIGTVYRRDVVPGMHVIL